MDQPRKYGEIPVYDTGISKNIMDDDTLAALLENAGKVFGKAQYTAVIEKNIRDYYKLSKDSRDALDRMCRQMTGKFDGEREAADIVSFEMFRRELTSGKLNEMDKRLLSVKSFLQKKQSLSKIVRNMTQISEPHDADYYKDNTLDENGLAESVSAFRNAMRKYTGESPEQDMAKEEQTVTFAKDEQEKAELENSNARLDTNEKPESAEESLQGILERARTVLGKKKLDPRIEKNLTDYYRHSEESRQTLTARCEDAAEAFDGGREAAEIVGYAAFCQSLERGKISLIDRMLLKSADFLQQKAVLSGIAQTAVDGLGAHTAQYYQSHILNEDGLKISTELFLRTMERGESMFMQYKKSPEAQKAAPEAEKTVKKELSSPKKEVPSVEPVSVRSI